jgi:arylsulfatase A-like enzyme
MRSTVRARRRAAGVGTLACSLACVGCAAESAQSPPAISLGRAFAEARVTESPETEVEFSRLALGFGPEATLAAPEGAGATRGWRALHDVGAPRIEDGRLVATATGKLPVLAVAIPEGELPSEILGAIEIDLAVSKGEKLGVLFVSDEELDVEELVDDIEDEADPIGDLVTDLTPGEKRTYRLTEADSPEARSSSLGRIRHLALALRGGEGAEISLGAVRFVTRSEHLARIPAGFGWHGLSGVYRETVVARSPEQIAWQVKLGDRPWLDLAVGSPEAHPITYQIEVAAPEEEPIRVRRTVTERESWMPVSVDLEPLAGRSVEIALSLSSEEAGRVGFWGAPTIRHRGASPKVGEPTAARAALSDRAAPRGVILMVADTLRSDHLDAWGYERPTAPRLAALAAEGTRFADNVSQGSWTKIAVSAILTSLYTSTHGLEGTPDRIPASVTTLPEAFRDAGYATFYTSSVLFSGRNSNLQQGVEVLHERVSVEGIDDHRSKTSRIYVSRLIDWLDTHHEQPFFVFLHVFDPHSPYRPFEPWDRRWAADATLAAHEANLEKIDKVVEVFHGLPTAAELAKAGVGRDEYLEATLAWYDASIRAMDVEVARLFERLEEYGIADDVLFAFVADHGEEFFEHGRSWHGESIYGEMIGVPMFVRWPGVVPPGLVVERTTQSIDLMPTLLELARLPVPEQAQGRSLVPLMASPGDPAAYGGGRAPVFSETGGDDEEYRVPDAYTVIHDGWKLIWNEIRHDDRPELELFDRTNDPLDLQNVAEEHPEKVAELKRLLDRWKAEAQAARVSDEGLEEELSPAELEELKALGYLD